MEMSFKKCHNCEFSISLPTGYCLNIICTITGEEIEINKCPIGE